MDRPAHVSSAVTSSYTSQEQTYIQAQNYLHNQNYQTPCTQGQNYNRNLPNTSSYTPIVSGTYQQSLHKKGSLRNGDVLKRTRVQTMYELSQDLLDKQIEVLERRYGGDKARKAALTIQRAFRRYTLRKKFAAITAMAKAEKRTSRRIPTDTETATQNSPRNVSETEQYMNTGYVKQYDSDQGCLNSLPTCRPLPVRSLSLRERRNVNNASLPRSQSGTPNVCWENCGVPSPRLSSLTSHNQSLQHYYSQTDPNLKQVQCNMMWEISGVNQMCNTAPGTSINGYNRPHPHVAYSQNCKKVPPEVPKRTSSISSRSIEPRPHRANGLTKTTENGSLSSVQSSGSDSSVSTDRVNFDGAENSRYSVSPSWKRQVHPSEYQEAISETSLGSVSADRVSFDGTENSRYSVCPSWKRQVHSSEYPEAISETSLGSISHTSGSAYTLEHSDQPLNTANSYKISETVRKRQYRVGLNLFNKKPERGIAYLIRRNFLENSPQGVARFLISRKGLSKQMIGEYLGNLQSPFCMTVLECFAHELDLSGMQIDVALRKYQAYFRMPGEAQKIERLMEVFSHRYCNCNMDIVARLRSPDTVFVLAFAIIMLNTDLHTPNLKPERRMRLVDFIKNLRGIDDCGDIDSDMLAGVYERVKANEFKPGSDHVTQVMKVQATIVGKKPNLALPHRRLVCYCRLYEIPDINKKERPGVHQREVFLFNDLLVITKILSKKKSSVTYTFRKSFPLCGMIVTLFESAYYPYGIRLSQRVDGKMLIVFNARNEHDRFKFAEDLRESICEMDEMENLRIEAELERQKSNRGNRSGTENRDSGVADVEVYPCTQNMTLRSPEQTSIEDNVHDAQFKRSALSNSLMDIHEQFAGEKAQRRGSVGSLDSGMSVSFHSSSTSNDKFNMTNKGKASPYQQSFLGGLFNKRERNVIRTDDQSQSSGPFIKSTDV